MFAVLQAVTRDAAQVALETLAAFIGQPVEAPRPVARPYISPLAVTPVLSIPDTIVTSTDRIARVAVRLSEPARRPLSWRCLTANGSAYSPAFYAKTETTVQFLPGETVKVVEVPILRDMTGKDLRLGCSWSLNHPPIAGAMGVIRGGATATPVAVRAGPIYPAAQRTAGRTLVFQSDFLEPVTPEGGAGKWRSRFTWGRWQSGNKELAPNVDASTDPGTTPHPIVDGKRVLRAEWVPTKDSGKTFAFSAPMMTTQGAFAFKHGYIELRARTDRAAGTIPAFWLLPKADSWPPEIDIFEMGLGGGDRLAFSIHFKDQTGKKLTESVQLPWSPDDGKWHVYGLDWTEDWLVLFVDGVEVSRRPTPADFNVEMYAIVNIAVGGLAPNPAGGPGWKSEMALDYLKVWQ